MGVGGVGCGFGVLGMGPNPQSPIPNPQSPIPILDKKYKVYNYIYLINKNIKYI
jgi:hypothetical protein